MPRRLTALGSVHEPAPRSWSLSARDVLGSVVALATVAIAQPLLDLLGRNAAFLVAHDATRVDVVVLALGMTLGLPLLLGGAVLALRRVHRPTAAAVHAAMLGLLAVVLVLVVARVSGIGARLEGGVVIGAAVLVAVLVPVLYRRSAAARRAAAFAAATAPAVAAVFLFASPASALVIEPSVETASVSISADAPSVIVVVFDELPVASLLRTDGAIDARAFPAFARLADDALFLRNATTVAQQTSDSIPAALTGRYADLEKLPVSADHPDNLIAVLGEDLALHVEEPLTQLCPPGRCRGQEVVADRYRTLLRDLFVVASHLVLPADLAEGMPPIDHGWRDFRAAAAGGKEAAVADRFWEARTHDPAVVFEEFVDGIDNDGAPALHFIHTLLPHHPWRYLSDGRSYTDSREVPGMEMGSWTGDPWALTHSYQRHLIQTSLADRLLGQLLDRLIQQQLYDDAVVVVMADHGVTFEHGTSMRGLGERTFGGVAAVPLLVKLPGQREGAASDDPVELVDVAPTILEAIGAEPPPGIDGRSLVGQVPVRSVKRFDIQDGTVTQSAAGEEKWPIVQDKNAWFSHEGPYPYPYNVVPGRDPELLGLLGTPVPSDAPPPVDGVAVTVADPGAWDDVELDAPTVPALIEGRWTGPIPRRQPVVAVGVNGVVAAVTVAEDTPERFVRAMIPPGLLRDGRNDVTLWMVQGSALVPVQMARSSGAARG